MKNAIIYFSITVYKVLLTISFLVVISTSVIPSGNAQPLPCEEISKTYKDKLIISDVKGLPSPTKLLTKRDVKSALNMKIEALKMELKDLVTYVFCRGRFPSGESDFKRDLSAHMNDYNVVLEVWGETSGQKAVINYLVIPIRYYEHFEASNPKLTGFHEIYYLRKSTASSLSTLFREAPEARALATLALGVKYLKRARSANDDDLLTTNYNRAREFFCSAVAILEKNKPDKMETGLEQDDWDRLYEYAIDSAKKTAEMALADQRYFGTLRELDKKRLANCGYSERGNNE